MNAANYSNSVETTAPVSTPTYTDAQILGAYYVSFVIYPILLVTGSIGNVLNIIVLWHIKNASSTRIYLTFVAVADFIVLWLYLWPYIYSLPNNPASKMSNENGTIPAYFTSYVYFDGIRRWGFEVALQISDWTLLLFSCERLLKSTKPLYFRERLGVRSALTAEVILVLLCGIFTLFIPIEAYFCLPNYFGDLDRCEQDTTWLSGWKPVQNDAEIGVVIAKFAGILILNCALAVRLRRSKVSQLSQCKIRSEGSKSLSKIYLKSNVILLASAVLYLTTQLPALVVKILTLYAPDFFSGESEQFATPFVQMAFLTNYAVNFYLYFAVSGRFRDELCSIGGFVIYRVRKLPTKYRCTQSTQVSDNSAENGRERKTSDV